jgi:hypothetical protein
MAHSEYKLAWFKRNMNRVKTADTEELLFYTLRLVSYPLYFSFFICSISLANASIPSIES